MKIRLWNIDFKQSNKYIAEILSMAWHCKNEKTVMIFRIFWLKQIDWYWTRFEARNDYARENDSIIVNCLYL